MAKGSAAKARAEQMGYAKPKAYDLAEETIRLEFSDLDLDDFETAELAEALRLRLGSNADQIASRALLASLRADRAASIRASADEAVQLATLRRELDQAEALASMSTDDVVLKGAPGLTKAAVGRTGQALRILDRDGLAEFFYGRGRINRVQFDAGLAYRKRYEVAFKGLRSTLGTQASGVTPTIDEMVRSRTRLAKYELQRVAIEAIVLAASPRALGILRAVAGEGRALNTCLGPTKRSARDYAKALDLLILALDMCAHRLR